MSCTPRIDPEVTAAQVAAAEDALIAALDAADNEQATIDRIRVAADRLRLAQAAHAAAKAGIPHLPDLVGMS